MFALVALCFTLSGASALIFQVAWARQFAVVLGTSELAIAAVLAAFMGGLALGAFAAGHFERRVRRPLHVYAALEFGIAIFAVVFVPGLIWLLNAGVIVLLGNQTAPPNGVDTQAAITFFIGALLIIGAPAALMGATLPILLRFSVLEDRHVGVRTGVLYALNTLGAVVGALASAFVLLPLLGVSRSTWFAAGLNLVAGVVALTLANAWRKERDKTNDGLATGAAADTSFRVYALLLVMLGSGVVSFLHEVLWTRLLSHVMGGSIRSFGVMLATFLAGIAIGGLCGGLLARRRESAILALTIAQLAVAVCAILAWRTIAGSLPDMTSEASRLRYCFKVMFPLALAIGVTFPLAVRAVTGAPEETAQRSAQVYSWNTIGCVIGATLGAFVIIPAVRYEGAIQLAVFGSSVLAAVGALFVFSNRRITASALMAGALALCLWFRPPPPTELVSISPLIGSSGGGVVFYGVGRSADVLLLERDDGYYLRTNGLPEAFIDRPGAPPYHLGETWMAPLAALARPQARSLLIVGLGSGRTVMYAPGSITSIDIIELEPQVIAANRFASARRAFDPLSDPRISLIENDARGALSLTSRQYDVIISQPSHPWTAGASHLYTREFLDLAKAHLTRDGVFVQWIGTDYLDETLLRAIVATASSVFAHVRVYRPSERTILLMGSQASIDPEAGWTATTSSSAFRAAGMLAREDVASALVLDSNAARAFAAGQRPVTDDHNLFATSDVLERGEPLTASTAGAILLPQNVLPRLVGAYRARGEPLATNYIVQRLLNLNSHDRSVGDLATLLAAEATPDQGIWIRAAVARSARSESADGLLSQGLRQTPTSDLLRFETMRPALNAASIPTGTSLLSSEPRAVVNAVHLANSGDWDGVASLESTLSGVAATAPWASTAARVRAEWRIRMLNETNSAALSAEAIEIIDVANTAHPTIELLWLRMQVGERSGRHDVELETGLALARAVQRESGQMSDAERERTKVVVLASSNLLWPILTGGGRDADRARRVRYRLDRAAQTLARPRSLH
ncbi:Spermidine synthase [Terricaulis silvestris]|uniref:Spermidine synthase n=2 Tax=Terricaulis silvestris TaxID=2686094 RepID=A0A6I6MFW3_9CAUL|nr:Spermidine synthase [Terricaulis silvestris]